MQTRSEYQTKNCRNSVVLCILVALFCIPPFYLHCTKVFPFSFPAILSEIRLLHPLRDGVSRFLKGDGVTSQFVYDLLDER